MKKRVFIISVTIAVLVIELFILTGCKNNSTEKSISEATINGIKYSLTDSDSFHGMKFKYEKDAKNFNIKGTTQDNNMVLLYLQDGTDDDLFRIVLNYHKDTKVSEELKKFDLDESTPTKNYNNIKWYDWYTTEKYKSTIIDVYFYQNGNDTYVISFSTPKSSNFDLDSYVKLFMTNISF